MRRLARGPSAMLMVVTPKSRRAAAALILRSRSKPSGGLISTLVTNSPAARRAPKVLRSARGMACSAGTGCSSTASLWGASGAIMRVAFAMRRM